MHAWVGDHAINGPNFGNRYNWHFFASNTISILIFHSFQLPFIAFMLPLRQAISIRLYIKDVYQQHILLLMDLGKVVSSATFFSVTADIDSLSCLVYVVWHTTSSFIKTLWRDILLALKIFVNVFCAEDTSWGLQWPLKNIEALCIIYLCCFLFHYKKD